ncbi:hypothetical protein BN59_01454 [Legionella massiliensis]|uniref:Uncharacterized protein n=1 Tax=Legionella massiliensis TaxID=1034943 RepID=A0A078KVY5_9GAMM|nr:hypothetical protein [Legionella massiliensis]CDZ77172.1 hypothetical protein BN59_01454 [Legionella massiliensis]CEE12910.1 hypothetical protein BN1094_01454 [Legionella massiliensis]
MTISTLADLRQNKVFLLLNEIQSEYDAADSAVLSDRFTRSPMHAIQFLIAYAGLDQNQRRQVIVNLDYEIALQELDALIDDIDWAALLNSPKRETLDFEFTISLADRGQFLSAVKSRCPQLYTALHSKENGFVHIENADEVIFTTKIAQKEKWLRPFERWPGDNFWIVPDFRLSDAVLDTLNSLPEGKKHVINGFTLSKGRGWKGAPPEIELHIAAPRRSNQYAVESKIKTNQGIYGAFVGLENFYGLHRVDDLRVEIENKAMFSDEGAWASQTQVNTYIAESGLVSFASTVEVTQINAFFEGAGIVASFIDGTEKGEHFDSQFYVELPTQNQENGPIRLFASAPKPQDAFILVARRSELSSSQNMDFSVLKLQDDFIVTARPSGFGSSQNIDIEFVNTQKNEGTTNYSFYLKCLSGFAFVAGGALLVVGLIMVNPILWGVGAAAFGVGGLSLFGLFAAGDCFNSSPKNESQEPSFSM